MIRRLTFLSLFICLLTIACQQENRSPVRNLIFEETFAPEQLGAWQIEGDSVARTAVIDEQLIIEIDAPQTVQYAALNEPFFTNFILETEVRQLRGDPQGSFGLLFRMQGPDQFYRFEITGTGQFMLERRNADGTWTRFLDDWTSSDAINQGINATNRLKVIALERSISIYANDVLLHQISDNLYPSGNIALDAGTFTAAELKVVFDNITVSNP